MVWQALRDEGVPSLYLDGDVLREMLGAVNAHSPEERLALAQTYGRICHALAAQGMTVVCSTISMFHAVRRWNRQHNPRHIEVYLRVPMPNAPTMPRRPSTPLLHGPRSSSAIPPVISALVPVI